MNTRNNAGGIGGELRELLRKNVKSYMMYIVLVVIMVFFQVRTGGLFFKPANISNLFNQVAYVAVLAIGMTVVLILRQIDLSVGYVAGFCGAVAALLLRNTSIPVGLVLLIVLLIGAAIGVYQGTLVTYVGVPAFVTTLAGMFIFRGILSVALSKNGTINISNETYNALCNSFIPDFMSESHYHVVTMVIAVIAVLLIVWNSLKSRRNKIKYNLKVSSMPVFTAQQILFSAVLLGACHMLASYKGLPWSIVIVGVILLVYNYVLNNTKLGRAVYGIGGNEQAAALSGINVRKVKMIAFISMSTMAALSGIMYSSRLKSASPAAGVAFEMDAIASAYIGGVAVAGGSGKVTNAIVGTFIIMALTNGMNLLRVDISYQYIVKGLIFIAAVAFDVRSKGQ